MPLLAPSFYSHIWDEFKGEFSHSMAAWKRDRPGLSAELWEIFKFEREVLVVADPRP